MALKNYVAKYAEKFRLTERECEVFQLLTNRVVSPQGIGSKMNISLHTVNNHLKKILEKTNSDSKTELLADFLLFLEQERSEGQPAMMSPRVLLLDDETDLTQMLQNFFRSRGVEAVTYNDPVEALDAIRKLKIDVVISDIRMPRMNGIKFLQEMRKFHFYEPGMIFISAFPEEHGVDELLNMGAFAFLDKPVNLEKLYRLVWEYVFGTKGSSVQSPISISLNDIRLSAEELGFGGFFLSESQLTKNPGVALDSGEMVKVQFQLPDSSNPMSALCEVVWRRNAKGERSGYGLRFVDLEKQAMAQVLDLVRTHSILSFIPSCQD